MSQQQEAPLPPHEGDQLNRVPPVGGIQADEIIATNVANVQYIGTQHITVLRAQSQQLKPPFQRPRRAEHFVDRTAEQAKLLAELKPGRIVTLCGPGGMGKTALVAEVLWKLAPGDTLPEAFPDGLFFHSFYHQSEAAIVLEQLARAFGEEPLPTPAYAAKHALSRRQALLIFDGAEEADHLEQVLEVCVDCGVLVTSRHRADAANPAYRLDLRPLPREEAVSVVQAWGQKRAMDETITRQICQIVGDLPLALRLVGRYLAQQEEEASEYLIWLQESPLAALDQGTSQHTSVPVLLERSVNRLSAAARQVLTVLGLLALAPVGRDLIAQVLDLSRGAASRALGELVNYGLLLRLDTLYELSHPLIHTYTHEALLPREKRDRQQTLPERVVRVLAERFPEVTAENRGVCEELLPHVQTCAERVEPEQMISLEAAFLFARAGDYLYQQIRYEEAEPLYQRALGIREQQLGPLHPDTAQSLNRLAGLYKAQGQYEQAEPLYQRALAIREQQLGPLHPHTAQSLNNLAALYVRQGQYEQAEPLYQRALAIREQQLGPLHPDTAQSLNNLAALYASQGKYEQAEPLYQRALAIYEQQLGPLHPHTATNLNNLAVLYANQGQYEQAEPLYQRALAIREQQLGPLHPDTAQSLNNLAALYKSQGKYEQAQSLLQSAQAIREAGLGSDYPNTITIPENYADLL